MDREGQVRITSRLVGLKKSILDIKRLYGKPGPKLLKFLRVGTLAKARSGKSGRRAVSFTSRAAVAYNDDGSVTVDVRRVLDDRLRAGMRAEVAASGRFDHQWIAHATLKDMSWQAIDG